MANKILIFTCLLGLTTNVNAADVLTLQKLADNTYAIIGPLGNRDKDNLGNNANFGFVVTDQGVLLIDPGGTYRGAAQIHKLIKTVTNQPINRYQYRRPGSSLVRKQLFQTTRRNYHCKQGRR